MVRHCRFPELPSPGLGEREEGGEGRGVPAIGVVRAGVVQHRFSATKPPKTRHIHCVSGFPLPTSQASTRCVPSEVRDLPRLVLLNEGLVLGP